MDDSASLLAQCRQGDESALTELVRQFQERVFRLAYRVVGDAALAQEATALTFLKIWTKAGQWRGETGADTWIYRIAVRTVLDTRRGQRRWWQRWAAPLPETLADHRAGPLAQLTRSEEEAERDRKVQEALGHLSETERALIHLYYFENRSLAELEAILGDDRSVLKTRLARARQRLRLLLEPDDESP